MKSAFHEQVAPSGINPAIVAATGLSQAQESATEDPGASKLAQARAFSEPLLRANMLDTGENAWEHACGVADILRRIGAGPATQAASFLVYSGDFLQRPQETIARSFGDEDAELVALTRKLVQVQRAAREADVEQQVRRHQTERVRKMLLAFSRDLRVVLLRLASRLQTLRWHAAAKVECPVTLARETLDVFAPLANRLGIWQIKWELEDLAFRFLQPQAYRGLAQQLDETRIEREQSVRLVETQVSQALHASGIQALVQGRPKHLYSIWKKMQGKSLELSRIFDMRALRVIVNDVPACYTALSVVHSHYPPIVEEFDDYIARPKPNGYQSLHTVVRTPDGRPVEIQIRTTAMHEHAEHGVAAHWAYKEAGSRGYAGMTADAQAAARLAQARKAVMRQLLAWESDLSQRNEAGRDRSADDCIYVLTPQSTVVELPAGATAVDFAYSLHTELGHRCRGARVDGVMVPLHTPLKNGQTVEVVAAKEGGPSLDWLNPELGYLQSSRARTKVRAWFNAQSQQHTIARGRELVERLLQREGKTALNLDDLAGRLGFKEAQALFEVVGKDEYSLRNIEQLLRPEASGPADHAGLALHRSKAGDSGVLVVGVESLMTHLSRCCRPAPPDAIGGFVTRGRGVAIHRLDCTNFRHMVAQSVNRVIPVAWGQTAGREAVYPVDVLIEASDRQGLLRDISEVFAKERVNVTGVNTQSVKVAGSAVAKMTFTVEVTDAARLSAVLRQVAQVAGVHRAKRR